MSKSRGGSSKSSSGKPADAAQDAASEGAGSLDKVRDILFGEQSRRSEQRLEQLDARLREGLSKTDERQDAALAALSQKMDDAVRSLQDAAKSGAGEQAEQLRALETQLSDRQAEQELALEAMQDKLRAENDAQHEALRADLRAAKQELSAATDALTQEMRGALIDRARLAGLFRELADALGPPA